MALLLPSTTKFYTITANDAASTSQSPRQLYYIPKVVSGQVDLPDDGDDDEDNDESSPLEVDDETWQKLSDKRTIVIYGTPVHYTEAHLKQIFIVFGEVENCIFHQTNDLLSRIAEITFIDDDSYNIAFTATTPSAHINSTQISLDESKSLGVSKYHEQWLQIHPDVTTLERQVNLFMMNWDQRATLSNQQSKRPIVDEDGFTLVVDKKDGVDTTIAAKRMKKQSKARMKKQDEKLRERRNTSLPFYEYHEKEQNRQKEQAMLKSTTRDAQVIGKLKKTRSFNPY